MLRDDKQKGCSFLEEVKSDTRYLATIRYEEHHRDKHSSVQGIVYQRNGQEYKSLENAVFLTEDAFTGTECKAKAARHVEDVRQSIERQYFPLGPQK